MKKEQDKERIEEELEAFKPMVIHFIPEKKGVSDVIQTYLDEFWKKQKPFLVDYFNFKSNSIRTEVDKEWREKIKNVKYDYPKSENQKEHERNIDIIERAVNQIKNQLLQ